MPSMLDRIRMLQSGTIPPPPVATLVGFTLGAVEPGSAVVELEATERHANPMGTVHGGILCDVAAAAMGTPWAAGLPPAETFTTLGLQIHFLKPAGPGKPAATGPVAKGGRRTGPTRFDTLDT